MQARMLMGGVLLFGCLAVATNASADRKLERLAAEHGWKTDYRQGLADAKKTGRPLLVVFRCQP